MRRTAPSRHSLSLIRLVSARARTHTSNHFHRGWLIRVAIYIGHLKAQDLRDIQHSKVAAGVDLGPYANSTWAASAPDAFVGAAGPYFTWPVEIAP